MAVSKEYIALPLEEYPAPTNVSKPRYLSLGCDGITTPSNGSPSPNNQNFCIWPRAQRRQTRFNTQLLRSIQQGTLADVVRCLDNGASVNATCRATRCTAANLAALFGFREILAELLRRGACIDLEDVNGQNILHYLAYAEHVDCLQDVIAYANSISTNFNILATIVNQSARPCKDTPLVKMFSDNLEHNCPELELLIPVLERGCTPLHIAAQKANIDITKILVQIGADPNIEDQRGCLPMNVIGEAFLQTGYEDLEGEIGSFLETIQYFKSIEANFVEREETCLTPLHTAIELEHLDSVKLLLSYGANPGTYNSQGETALHMAIQKHREEIFKVLLESLTKDHEDISLTNKCGYTPFQAAVELQWIPGITLLLEAGADVTETTHSGDSALHLAAATGNIDLVEELLDISDTEIVINRKNKIGETPLLCAIKSGSLQSVQALLKAGADPLVKLPDNLTIVHRTTEYGFSDILEEIIVTTTHLENHERWLNERDTLQMSGMTALHMAANRNLFDCARILLEAGCDSNIITTANPYQNALPIHLAAAAGHHSIVELLLQHDKNALNAYNAKGWNALHIAAKKGHRECVQVLLNFGADLSLQAFNVYSNHMQTAVDMIMHNVSRPTEFMEQVFDSCVTKNEFSINDPLCTVNVTYDILAPRNESGEQMRVMKAIMNTGNRFGQKKLLLHPVVESFLYLKWKTLCPFFYLILIMYIFYVASLTIVATSIYYFEIDQSLYSGIVINRKIWGWILMISLVIIVIQEILHAKQYFSKYLYQLETWIKWCSFALSGIVAVVDHSKEHLHDWPRHITSVALLLAWIELMFLFSRFPDWGYYVLMFFKVSKNVIKVLLTFGFLVIGFSLSFLIEFRAVPPFGSPWEAIVKTIVMMTSEFDYVDLFDKPDDEKWIASLVIGRMVFVVFLVLASIVLMNLMVGLAVSDINVLKIQGKIERLEKQVDFLGALDVVLRRVHSSEQTPIQHSKQERGENVPLLRNTVVIYPGKPCRRVSRSLPLALKDQLIDRAAEHAKREEEVTSCDLYEQIESLSTAVMEKLECLKEGQAAKIEPHVGKPKKLQQYVANVSMMNDVAHRIAAIEDNITKPKDTTRDLSDRLYKLEGQITSLQEMLAVFIEKNTNK